MAREKVKGFDADKFIESVRESAVPTYHTASDSVKPEKKKEECAATSVEKTPIQENPAPIPYPDDDADKYARLNLIESEVDFVKTYVARRNYNQVSKHGKPVFIRERHRTFSPLWETLRICQDISTMFWQSISKSFIQQFRALPVNVLQNSKFYGTYKIL